MQKILAGVAVTLVAMVGTAMARQAKASHIMVTAAELKWGEAPPVFEKGASFTVVSGDPGKAGFFVVRLKLPAGYRIAPHWHPTDEHVTVISGTFALGMGEKFDKATMKSLSAGGYALLPAEMRHFAMATTAATVQVTGQGPFVLITSTLRTTRANGLRESRGIRRQRSWRNPASARCLTGTSVRIEAPLGRRESPLRLPAMGRLQTSKIRTAATSTGCRGQQPLQPGSSHRRHE